MALKVEEISDIDWQAMSDAELKEFSTLASRGINGAPEEDYPYWNTLWDMAYTETLVRYDFDRLKALSSYLFRHDYDDSHVQNAIAEKRRRNG